MGKSLAAMASGDDLPSNRKERELAKQAQPLYDEVRLAALKVEGSMALAAHAMAKAAELDQVRRRIAGNDEVLNQVLAEFELEAVRQAKNIQAGLYSRWGLA